MTDITAITISDSFRIDSLLGVESYEHRKIHDGDQALIYFVNGYGASVVRHSYSYGGRQGFYEIAIIQKSSEDSRFDGDFKIVFDTPITDDVLGRLTKDDVIRVLRKIQAL